MTGFSEKRGILYDAIGSAETTGFMKEFHSHGIHFEYPDGWRINQDLDGTRVVLTLTGPGTAFWVVSICRERPDRELLMEEALGSFREDYLGCDIYDGKGEICLLPTLAKCVDFIHHDLISTAELYACETDDATLLVLSQVSDVDKSEADESLAAITESLMYEPSNHDADDEPDGKVFEYDNLFRHAAVDPPEPTPESEARPVEVKADAAQPSH